MARPQKQGLDYFPLDVDFLSDKKIKILKSRYGSDGVMVYIYLLCEMYKNGYCILMDEDYEYVIKDDLGLKDTVVSQVMQFLFSRSLLTEIVAGSDTYITSRAVQKRFQEAIKQRKKPFVVDSNLWLLDEEETLSCIKVTLNNSLSEINTDKSEINGSLSEINTTKESKVKESKVNKSNNIVSAAELSATSTNDYVIALILTTKEFYLVRQADVDRYTELYPAVNVVQELRSMAGWLEANPKRRKTKSGINKFINSWLAKTQNRGGAGYGAVQFQQAVGKAQTSPFRSETL